MQPTQRITVEIGDWARLEPLAAAVRRKVFVGEQGVPEAIEWDAGDAQCVHALARIDGEVAGTGRLLPDGHIGRMAVLAAYRGRGVGAAILLALLEQARRRGHRQVELSAQRHAEGFYARLGFDAVGEPYDEVGIAHIRMVRRLDPAA